MPPVIGIGKMFPVRLHLRISLGKVRHMRFSCNCSIIKELKKENTLVSRRVMLRFSVSYLSTAPIPIRLQPPFTSPSRAKPSSSSIET